MLNFRATVLADNRFIKDLFAASLPLYANLMPESFAANLQNMDILTDKGLAFNATGLDGWLILANDQAVGFAGIGPLNPEQAYLAALYFLPAAQRQGYGQVTLDWLESSYHSQGFEEILLLVHEQAEWAQNFYRKAGYRILAHEAPEMIAYAGERMLHLLEPGLILLGNASRRPER